MVRYPLCPDGGFLCFRNHKCIERVEGSYRAYVVCVRKRFSGANSVLDRGLGMTIYEKLKRQGLISDE